MTLDQLRERFSDEAACLEFFESVIWANGRRCAHCGYDKSYPLRGNTSLPGTYECAGCKKQFRVTTKTPMHGTKMPFWKWIQAMYYITNSGKGISSVILGRWLGISQPAAWKMGHAVREMMTSCGQLAVSSSWTKNTWAASPARMTVKRKSVDGERKNKLCSSLLSATDPFAVRRWKTTALPCSNLW